MAGGDSGAAAAKAQGAWLCSRLDGGIAAGMDAVDRADDERRAACRRHPAVGQQGAQHHGAEREADGGGAAGGIRRMVPLAEFVRPPAFRSSTFPPHVVRPKQRAAYSRHPAQEREPAMNAAFRTGSKARAQAPPIVSRENFHVSSSEIGPQTCRPRGYPSRRPRHGARQHHRVLRRASGRDGGGLCARAGGRRRSGREPSLAAR